MTGDSPDQPLSPGPRSTLNRLDIENSIPGGNRGREPSHQQARSVVWTVPSPAAAICEWSARRLSVPPGHPDEGSPFVIPDYGQKFLADVYDPEILESLLCLARKQGKSAIVAVLILAHLSDDGPLRRRGWRAGVVSISKLKAGELKLQAQQIAEAAGLKGLHFWRSPAPGRPGCRRPHRWEPSRPVYAAWLIFSCSVVKIAK